MKKALLSLWLLGASTYTANVVILSASPSGSGGAVPECVEPKEPPIKVTVRPTEDGPAKTEQNGTANQSSSAPTADRIAAADSPAATPPKDSTHYDWAEIQRSGAYVHSESSVNAAVISILPVGKQLRILAYRNGWVQLQDTTGQIGWVYEQYVASIAVPNEQRHAASEPQPPPAAAPAEVQSRGRGPPRKVTAPPGAAPRWALGEDSSSQSSSDARDDRPAAAPREHTPSLADTYLRRFYRGY
jgi:hypothetical protein